MTPFSSPKASSHMSSPRLKQALDIALKLKAALATEVADWRPKHG